MSETVKKKRAAIYKSGSMTMRFDYPFITDEDLEKSLKEFADKLNAEPDSILVYTLGDEDEEENGVLYFCPKCGAYNEYGYDPSMRMFYRRDKEGEQPKEAGYFKNNIIDCTNCNEVFEIHTDKYTEQAEEMTKRYFGDNGKKVLQ